MLAAHAPHTHHTNMAAPRVLDPFFYAIILWGWFAYIFLAPIYLFESGLPQPADLIIFGISILAIGLYLIKYRIAFNRVFATLAVMVTLFGVINLTYGLHYGDSRFFYAILYYIFNAMAFGTTIILFKDAPNRAFDIARMAIIGALILELVWVFVFPSNSIYRETGSFNNPNQLGYWAILTSACLLALNHGRRMPVPDLFAILICAYLVAESLSRAAMISFALIGLSLFISKSIPMIAKVGVMVVACLYLLFQATGAPSDRNIFDSLELLDKVTARLNLIEDNDPEKFEERGYQRLWEFPQYLIYGAGEGANWRFMDILYAGRSISAGREIHSGLATIIFSYGIFGFTLFTAFIFTIFQRVPPIMWLAMAAVMAYGLTHQHVRFTGFWIYIGIVYGMTRYVFPLRERDENP
jgi:hypothetical protein